MRSFGDRAALAVSLTALVVAFGGTALASSYVINSSKQIKDGSVASADVANGSLTGADLKDGSVASADVANGSLTGTDLKDGSLSPKDFSGSVAGPKGDPGPQGATGPQGPVGPQGQSNVGLQVRTLTLSAGQSNSATAQCPTGSHIVGGGFNGPGPTSPGDLTTVPAVVTGSYATPPSSAAGYTAWTVSASAGSGAGASIQVFAVCSAP